jgi:beta-mannosidase
VSDEGRIPPTRARPRVTDHELLYLGDGWEAIATDPDRCADPSGLPALKEWTDAQVPGTAAGAQRAGASEQATEGCDFDAQEWWFRTSFDAAAAAPEEEVLLCFDGLATVCDVYLNGERLLTSDSMFVAHAVDVGTRLREHNELAIRCRALAAELEIQRRPRARWRTRLVANGSLRFFRTMLMGRTPGFAPGPAAVGPWRPVYLHRLRTTAVQRLALRARVDGATGVLGVSGALRSLGAAAPHAIELELSRPSGATVRAALECVAVHALAGDQQPVSDHPCVEFDGELRVGDVELWWPHTHGEPTLYDVRLCIDTAQGPYEIDCGRVGFRTLAFGPEQGHDVVSQGLDLRVNAVPVFCRGALWTPLNLDTLQATAAELRAALEQVRHAGMNMLRIPGTGAYEVPAFYDLCDELGILVWQDFMFANMDYPVADERFRAAVESEARGVLAEIASRPSLAVICGNSEVEQQVTMLGLDPALARGELFDELLPALVADSGADAAYIPSAPCGGGLPFRTNAGVANYFGVGGYRRPLEDARRAEVLFASECLAISNVPEQATLDRSFGDAPAGQRLRDPRWKAGVPRDVGNDWDFEDVRDHYLALLFGVDPVALRSEDPDHYLALSRSVSGEVMAAVFGEWRRQGSPCAGGLVLWLRDIKPGSGWGLVDSCGAPKAAYHHLRRAFAPVAVWTTDEGLNGIVAHVANERPSALKAQLRVALYSDFEHRVGEVGEAVELAARGAYERDLEQLLGGFVDASWSYRFGPPAQDLIVVSLETQEGTATRVLSQAVHFPAGYPSGVESVEQLGLCATAVDTGGGAIAVSVRCKRLAYGVRVEMPGFIPNDDVFCVEPGRERTLVLRAGQPGAAPVDGTLSAVNLRGRVPIRPQAEAKPA